jgi:hypothetical protein
MSPIEAPTPPNPGRILKIKYGINPNSSGVGSIPFTENIGTLLLNFPVVIWGFALGFSLVSSLIIGHFASRPKVPTDDDPAALK